MVVLSMAKALGLLDFREVMAVQVRLAAAEREVRLVAQERLRAALAATLERLALLRLLEALEAQRDTLFARMARPLVLPTVQSAGLGHDDFHTG